MTPRPPRDGVVALRSLPRRFRSLFAGLGDDESPDALAVRPAGDGTTALGRALTATEAIRATGHALDAVQADDSPTLAALPAAERGAPTGTVEERLSELGWEADALADRTEHVSADDWARRGRLPDGTAVSAADLLWLGVDAAVEQLHAAERALDEARRAR